MPFDRISYEIMSTFLSALRFEFESFVRWLACVCECETMKYSRKDKANKGMWLSPFSDVIALACAKVDQWNENWSPFDPARIFANVHSTSCDNSLHIVVSARIAVNRARPESTWVSKFDFHSSSRCGMFGMFFFSFFSLGVVIDLCCVSCRLHTHVDSIYCCSLRFLPFIVARASEKAPRACLISDQRNMFSPSSCCILLAAHGVSNGNLGIAQNDEIIPIRIASEESVFVLDSGKLGCQILGIFRENLWKIPSRLIK